jgi:hypothetical protein
MRKLSRNWAETRLGLGKKERNYITNIVTRQKLDKD